MSRFFQVIIRSAHGGALLKSNDKYNKKKKRKKERNKKHFQSSLETWKSEWEKF